MLITSFFRSYIRSRGYDIVRYTPEINRPFAVLPYLIAEKISNGKPFTFVQVGANDGILDDPIRESVCRYHLRGLLIEPLPDLFEKLKRNYSSETQLSFENVAILPKDDAVTIYRVREDAAVPFHWHGIASFYRNNLIAQGVPEEFIESLHVKGAPLKSVLSQHNIDDVTLLQIDTEGYDFEIIKSAFDAQIFPDIINYEHCWLIPKNRFMCKELLAKHGYAFIEVGKDTLATRTAL